jgi:hypothetical protein
MEVSDQVHTLTSLPPGKEPPVPIVAGWAALPVWTLQRGENDIKIDIKEMGSENVDSTGTVQGPMAYFFEYENGSWGSTKGGNFGD